MSIDWKTIFERPEEYDRLTASHEDIPFFVERAKLSGGPVLELACGTGRITLPIARTGIEIVGVDISPKMLQRAIEKSRLENLAVQWVVGSFSNFSLKKRDFSLIFVGYHSIAHIVDFDSFQLFFSGIRNHLRPDGTVIFDCWNPGCLDMDLMGDPHLSPEEILTVNRLKWFDGDVSQRMLYFYPREFEALAKGFGFRVVEMLGDVDGRPYEPRGKRLITVFKKVS
jgi:SAM-dependent methyltransferase